jgi:peptidoglycan hydrolase CwlO-like protein
VSEELAETVRQHAAELSANGVAAVAREAALSAALNELESERELAAQRGEALASKARERAAAADKVAETYQHEMRRSVGVERQRVAGMLYKEALQSHTLEEQERQVQA